MINNRASGSKTIKVQALKPKTPKYTSKDYYKFGHNDNLAFEIIDALNNSMAAKRCAGKYAEYLAADGFVDERAAAFLVNPKETADKILSTSSIAMAYFGAVAYHIRRNGAGRVAEIKILPNQKLKRAISGGWKYNDTLGTDKVDQNAWISLQDFQGEVITTEQLAENLNGYGGNGEVYYVFNGNPFDAEHYAVPGFLAQFLDLKTASELSTMDYEAALNGFMLGGMLTFFGVDDTQRDSDKKSQRDDLLDALTDFTGLNKNSDGITSRFGITVNFSATDGQAPSFIGFDPKPILEATDAKADKVDRTICRAFKVPPVLVGFSDAAVLGNNDAMQAASRELNNNVNGDQRLITEAFTKMFGAGFDWTISEFTINQAALVKSDTQKTLDALTSLSPLVANKVLESMTADEIRALVALPPTKVVAPVTPPVNPVAP